MLVEPIGEMLTARYVLNQCPHSLCLFVELRFWCSELKCLQLVFLVSDGIIDSASRDSVRSHELLLVPLSSCSRGSVCHHMSCIHAM